jgi:hypothetical protein
VPVETFLSIITEEKLLSLVKSDTLVGIVIELGKAFTSFALSVMLELSALPLIVLSVGTAPISLAESVTSPVFPFTELTASPLPPCISILPGPVMS